MRTWSFVLLLACQPTNNAQLARENARYQYSSCDHGGGGFGDEDGDGYTPSDGDCDDNDPSINPSADEICDGQDNDCDGEIDQGLDVQYFLDADEDGYGDPAVTETSCEPTPGYVVNGTDCDDGDDAVFPGAPEALDGVDQDCDGVAESASVTWDETGGTVHLSGLYEGVWHLGLVRSEPGWYGESCISGPEPKPYDDGGVDVCHPVVDGTLLAVSDTASDTTTVATATDDAAGTLTYVLLDADGECLTWGFAPAYYPACVGL